MTKKLTKRDITKYRKTIGTAWKISETKASLDRTFKFPSFIEAFMFVTRVGVHAEVMRFYPHIEIDAHLVQLHISDATSAGFTVRQFELAEKVDVIFALSTSATTKERTRS
jgi:4a-hydroxytetrahydrobiopterin dehydratase